MTAPKKTKILVVDDDPGHLVSVKTIIRSWGYGVETADDGSVAVELVKSTPVDLISKPSSKSRCTTPRFRLLS
jgi:two-component system response regulator HydG